MESRLVPALGDFSVLRGGTAVALSTSDVSNFSAAERSILDNDEVVSYLHDLDSVEDFESERSPHLTSTPQFRAEVAALGEGMLDDDAPHHEAEVTGPQAALHRFVPAPDEDEADDVSDNARTSTADSSRLTGFGTALFLLGMSLLGASSAAIVFHDRISRILGW